MNTQLMSSPLFYVIASFVGIAIIALEFQIISYLVSKFKLSSRFAKPKEVIALVIMEILTLLMLIKDVQGQFGILIYSSLFLAIKLIGLWGMKKWVVYFYLLVTALSWGISYFSLATRNSSIALFGLLGGTFLLVFYYIKVYIPNKKLFT